MNHSERTDVSAHPFGFTLRCDKCGASLEAIGLADACPACGTPAERTVDRRVVDPITLTIYADVSCACGYNLRTLRLSANCPECNTPVAQHARPNDLRFADERWLRSMSLCLTGLMLSTLGVAVLTLLAAIVGGKLGHVVLHYGLLVPIGLGVLFALGLTVADPADLLPRRSGRLVWAVRAVIVGLSAVVVGQVLDPLPTDAPEIYVTLTFLIVGVGLTLLLAWLRPLARRARNRQLWRFTGRTLITFIVAIVAATACHIPGALDDLRYQRAVAAQEAEIDRLLSVAMSQAWTTRSASHSTMQARPARIMVPRLPSRPRPGRVMRMIASATQTFLICETLFGGLALFAYFRHVAQALRERRAGLES